MRRSFKSRLAVVKTSLRRSWVQCLEPWRRRLLVTTPDDLTRAIRSLGIGPGQTLIVDSGFDQMRFFRGTVTEAVEAVIEAVQPGGTVVMPAFSFSGRSYDYLLTKPRFDLRRTPACTGLLAECLRRRTGAFRSLHPTHSVVAWGPKAREITADHHNSRTPFDGHSPWQRLFELGAWDMTLGVSLDAGVTHHHYFEELLEPLLGVRLYWPEAFEVEVCDGDGAMRRMRTYAHDPSSKGTRDYERLNRQLLEAGAMKHRRVGAIDLWAGEITRIFEVTRRLAEEGVTAFQARPLSGTSRDMGFSGWKTDTLKGLNPST